jgi:hypothetical protein
MKLHPDQIKLIKKRRLEDNWSVRTISRELNIPKTTVRQYTKGLRENNPLVDNKIGELTKTRWQLRREAVVAEAIIEYEKVKYDLEMQLFLGLYWGEGQKANSVIGVTNNDPYLLKICYNIFKKLSPTKKIGIEVFCYPTHDKHVCRSFWENLFGTTVIIKDAKDQRMIPLTELHPRCLYGRGVIRYSHFEVYWRIMTWLNLIKSTCRF